MFLYIFGYRVLVKGINLCIELKYIVFFLQFLLLFGFCYSCKIDNLMVDVDKVGIEVVVISICLNFKCFNLKFIWYSQLMMFGIKLLVGNFFFCMVILVVGVLVFKVFIVFVYMGFGCIFFNIFFKYQRVSSYENIV